jgi:hypothetical protein
MKDKTRPPRWLTAILNEIDPEGLIGIGAPGDEYTSEARSIAAAMKAKRPVTAALIRDVWLYWFGTGQARDGVVQIFEMPMRPAFRTIARRINARLRERLGGGS